MTSGMQVKKLLKGEDKMDANSTLFEFNAVEIANGEFANRKLKFFMRDRGRSWGNQDGGEIEGGNRFFLM